MPDDARDAIARIERSAVLRLDGVHTHVGSQLLNVEQLAAAVEPIAKLGTFDIYDLGGGLGVRYTYDEHPPSLDDYAEAMVAQARALLPAGAPHHRRARPQHGRRTALHGLPGHDRQARRRHPCRGRRRDGRQPRGVADRQRFEATIVDRLGGGETVTRGRAALRVG